MEKAYWSIKELSQYTGIKEGTLYTWVNAKKIPYTRLNGLIRFKIETVMKWLEKREIKPKRIIE